MTDSKAAVWQWDIEELSATEDNKETKSSPKSYLQIVCKHPDAKDITYVFYSYDNNRRTDVLRSLLTDLTALTALLDNINKRLASLPLVVTREELQKKIQSILVGKFPQPENLLLVPNRSVNNATYTELKNPKVQIDVQAIAEVMVDGHPEMDIRMTAKIPKDSELPKNLHLQYALLNRETKQYLPLQNFDYLPGTVPAQVTLSSPSAEKLVRISTQVSAPLSRQQIRLLQQEQVMLVSQLVQSSGFCALRTAAALVDPEQKRSYWSVDPDLLLKDVLENIAIRDKAFADHDRPKDSKEYADLTSDLGQVVNVHMDQKERTAFNHTQLNAAAEFRLLKGHMDSLFEGRTKKRYLSLFSSEVNLTANCRSLKADLEGRLRELALANRNRTKEYDDIRQGLQYLAVVERYQYIHSVLNQQYTSSKFLSLDEEKRYKSLLECLLKQLNEDVEFSRRSFTQDVVSQKLDLCLRNQRAFLSYAEENIAELKKASPSTASNFALAEQYKSLADYLMVMDRQQAISYYELARKTFRETILLIEADLVSARGNPRAIATLLQQKQELLIVLAEISAVTDDVLTWYLRVLRAYSFCVQHKLPGWQAVELQLKSQMFNRNDAYVDQVEQEIAKPINASAALNLRIRRGLLFYSLAYSEYITGEDCLDYVKYFRGANNLLSDLVQSITDPVQRLEITDVLRDIHFILTQQIAETEAVVKVLEERAKKFESSYHRLVDTQVKLMHQYAKLLRFKEAKGDSQVAKLREKIKNSYKDLIKQLEQHSAIRKTREMKTEDAKRPFVHIVFTENILREYVDTLTECADLYFDEGDYTNAVALYQKASSFIEQNRKMFDNDITVLVNTKLSQAFLNQQQPHRLRAT